MKSLMRNRRRLLAGGVVLAGVMALVGLLVHPTDGRSEHAPLVRSIWSDSSVPAQPDAGDPRSVEVGLKFTTSASGILQGLRFYRAAANVGPHVGYVRDAGGRALAEVAVAEEAPGWQEARFATGVPVQAGNTLIVSYQAPAGHYAADVGFFDAVRPDQPSDLRAVAGVYRYSPDEEFKSWRGTNYWVDPLFQPQSGTASSMDPHPARPEVALRQVDGGSTYYGNFTDGLPTSPNYFPVAVWFESVKDPGDAQIDRAAGLNLYVELTSDSSLAAVRGEGMHALTSWDRSGSPNVGSLLSDEADMWAGPGDAPWSGKSPGEGEPCIPVKARCGYSVMETLGRRVSPKTMTYANYGKGVLFWESDSEAARFVNDFQDVTSADAYWFTDRNICSAAEGGRLLAGGQRDLTDQECRRANNYGRAVDRLRSLVQPGGSKPVWSFVELGHPSTEGDLPSITAPQIRAAVWSSLIHGARGIVYFNHNFGGECLSQHVLRDACGAAVRPTVTALNQSIARLAPVLNAPFVDNLVSSTDGVDVAVKLYDHDLYVLAGSTRDGSRSVALRFACSARATAEVVDEDRTVPVNDGILTDTFADADTVHIYKVPPTGDCAQRVIGNE